MDSGNSGSLQSSSGGDDEYNSRPDSLSAFLNNNINSNHSSSSSSSSFFSSISNHPPTLFDPGSSNLHPFPNQNPLYNLDLAWSRNLRSEPTFTDFTVTTPTQFQTSASTSTTQSLLGIQGMSQGPFPTQSLTDVNAVKPDQTNHPKNPKKRTRASRRAPTTVLTTDTSNFRQMVQEFTGIPAAPFSGTTYSRRLDLFGSGPSMRSSTNHLDSLYPLRPSPQKVQVQAQGQGQAQAQAQVQLPVSAPPPAFFLGIGNIEKESSSTQSLLSMQNNPILGFQQLESGQNLLGVEHGGEFNGSGDAAQGRESDGSIRWRDRNQGGGVPYEINNKNGKNLENVSSRGDDSWILPSD